MFFVCRGNSADSTLTESSTLNGRLGLGARRPKRPSPRKKVKPPLPLRAPGPNPSAVGASRNPPKRVLDLGGGDELQLMTEQVGQAFLNIFLKIQQQKQPENSNTQVNFVKTQPQSMGFAHFHYQVLAKNSRTQAKSIIFSSKLSFLAAPTGKVFLEDGRVCML